MISTKFETCEHEDYKVANKYSRVINSKSYNKKSTSAFMRAVKNLFSGNEVKKQKLINFGSVSHTETRLDQVTLLQLGIFFLVIQFPLKLTSVSLIIT